jgi:predicted secreted hydrolase
MSLKKTVMAACLALILAAGLGTAFRLRQSATAPAEDRNTRNALAAWLKETERFFPRELNAGPLAFPEDHGPHPDAPLEVWEFSGILATLEGRQFGFQWSMFRLGLRPDEPKRTSAWATNAVYRGLFAVSDGAEGRFHSFERFGRAALGLAGSEGSPQRIWLESWTMTVSQAETFDLSAAAEDISLKLRLESVKPAVSPGEDGVLGQGGGRLRAYSFSRLRAEGHVGINGVTHTVKGSAWLGRTWGRLLPPGGQTALNRYQIRLDDGREIAALQLRRRDGGAEPIHSGFWIERNGSTRPIRRGDLIMEPAGYWTSGESGARYPVRWRMLLPEEGLELDLVPLLEDQEIRGTARSWSGAVRVTGKVDGSKTVSGSGFVDLTGY